eukprot:2053967-Pyramimonas_sp.AAC.1
MENASGEDGTTLDRPRVHRDHVAILFVHVLHADQQGLRGLAACLLALKGRLGRGGHGRQRRVPTYLGLLGRATVRR